MINIIKIVPLFKTKFYQKDIFFKYNNKYKELEFKYLFLDSSYLLFFKIKNLNVSQINFLRFFILFIGYKFYFLKKTQCFYLLQKYGFIVFKNFLNSLFLNLILVVPLIIKEENQIFELISLLEPFQHITYLKPFCIKYLNQFYSYTFFKKHIINFQQNKFCIIKYLIIYQYFIIQKIIVFFYLYLLNNLYVNIKPIS